VDEEGFWDPFLFHCFVWNAKQIMPRFGVVILILFQVLTSGCNYCCWGKRRSEKNCPTDIRQTHVWCFGEDAIFHYPCGPNEEFYGYQPTCWREWPTSGAAWRDIHCPPGVAAPAAESIQFQPQENGGLTPPDAELPEPFPIVPPTPEAPMVPPQVPATEGTGGTSSVEFLPPQSIGPVNIPSAEGTPGADTAPGPESVPSVELTPGSGDSPGAEVGVPVQENVPPSNQPNEPLELPPFEVDDGQPLKESWWHGEAHELQQSAHVRSGEAVQPAYYRAPGQLRGPRPEQSAPKLRRLPPI
jgi:hypothetical protein